MFWGLIMEPQRRYTQVVKRAFHISMASLDISTSSEEPAQVMCGFEGRNYLLCTLRKPDMLQCALDLNFEAGDELSLATNGKCHIHLTGYLIDNVLDDVDEEEVEEDEADEEEEIDDRKDKKKIKRIKSELTNGPPPKKIKSEEQTEESDDDDDSDVDVNALFNSSLDSDEDDETFNNSVNEEEAEEEEEGENDWEDEGSTLSEGDSEEETTQPQPSKATKVKINGTPQKQEQPKDKKNKKNQQQQIKVEKNASPKKESPKKVLQNGIIIEELKEGQGQPAKSGKFLTVYYEGRLKSNNKMFDSTKQGQGFSFRLGGGEVIKGWDQGLVGMKIGGKRRITCPPHMAYGAKGSPPAIPGNSTLVFEVELRKIR